VTFGNSALPATTVTVGAGGTYSLRLRADDASAMTFKDITFTGYATPYELWQSQQFAATGGMGDPNSALQMDPDHDGISNLQEYALGTNPNGTNAAPISTDFEQIASSKYLRMSVTKNPIATDVQYIVEATNTVEDLLSWTSAGLITEINTATQLVVRDGVATDSVNRRFIRLRIVKP
jgi:hypothetical protein